MSVSEAGADVPEEIAALLNEVTAAINARDVDRLAELSVEGLEWRDPPGLAGGGSYRGPDEIIARFREFDEAFEGLRFSNQEMVGSGERVMVRMTSRGRGRESGVPADTEFFAVYRIEDARVASMTASFDRESAEHELRGD